MAIFSTESWQELKRIAQKEHGNCWSSERQGIAFTADSRFIWIGCGSQGLQGASKMTVPDLAHTDTVEIPQKVSLNSNVEYHTVFVQPKPLSLHVRTTAHRLLGSARSDVTKDSQVFKQPPDILVHIIDLSTKADHLPVIALSEGDVARRSRWSPGTYVSSDHNSVLIYRGQVKSENIATYDVATRKRTTLFAPAAEIRLLILRCNQTCRSGSFQTLLRYLAGRLLGQLRAPIKMAAC